MLIIITDGVKIAQMIADEDRIFDARWIFKSRVFFEALPSPDVADPLPYNLRCNSSSTLRPLILI